MALWNARVGVVELIDAETPDAALLELRTRLRQAGFETFEGDGDAFVSEPIEIDA